MGLFVINSIVTNTDWTITQNGQLLFKDTVGWGQSMYVGDCTGLVHIEVAVPTPSMTLKTDVNVGDVTSVLLGVGNQPQGMTGVIIMNSLLPDSYWTVQSGGSVVYQGDLLFNEGHMLPDVADLCEVSVSPGAGQDVFAMGSGKPGDVMILMLEPLP
jgi:hypothetical protein